MVTKSVSKRFFATHLFRPFEMWLWLLAPLLLSPSLAVSQLTGLARPSVSITFCLCRALNFWSSASDNNRNCRKRLWEGIRGNENAFSNVDTRCNQTSRRAAGPIWPSEEQDDEELCWQAKQKCQEVKNVGTSTEVSVIFWYTNYGIIWEFSPNDVPPYPGPFVEGQTTDSFF